MGELFTILQIKIAGSPLVWAKPVSARYKISRGAHSFLSVNILFELNNTRNFKLIVIYAMNWFITLEYKISHPITCE
jgi:hypothetical protein